MLKTKQFQCLLIGGTSFLTQCADLLLKNNHQIVAIVSDDTNVIHWCHQHAIKCIASLSEINIEDFSNRIDYLFSLVNFKILPKDILELPSKLAINYHDGPLPRYAGINTPTWAIMNGEKKYGITWHVMTEIADQGDILKQSHLIISDEDTSFTLNAKCYEAGVNSFSELIDELTLEKEKYIEHVLDKATYCPRNKRPYQACYIDWNHPAEKINAFFRALDFGTQPNRIGVPKIYLGNNTLFANDLEILTSISTYTPGTIIDISDFGIKVTTASNDVLVKQLVNSYGETCDVKEALTNAGLGVDDVFPGFPSTAITGLNKTDAIIYKFEPYWESKLTAVEMLELPYASQIFTDNNNQSYNSINFSIPRFPKSLLNITGVQGDLLTNAIVLYLGRLCGKSTYDIGYLSQRTNDQFIDEYNLISKHIPLKVDIDFNLPFEKLNQSLTSETQCVEKNGSFYKDLIGRIPELKKSSREINKLLKHVVIEHVNDLAVRKDTTDSDLSIVIDDNGHECLWIYNTSIFSDQAIKTMGEQFELFLNGIINKSSEPVCSFPLMTKNEKQKLLIKWNDTETDSPNNKCIHQLFEQQVIHSPDAIALSFRKEELTYQELNQKANKLAHYLMSKGAVPDSLIGVMLERSTDLVITLLGILKAGAAYVPLDPTFPKERISYMIEDAQLPLIITQEEHRELATSKNTSLVVLESSKRDIETQSSENPVIDVSSGNLAYVIYTSGSTGKPKGVMIEHRNAVNFFTGMDDRIEHESPGVWLAVTSISFDISVLELFWTLARGFKVVLFSDDMRNKATLHASTKHPAKNIDFSLFYWNLAHKDDSASNKYHLLMESAKFGDENGFTALWTPERHFHSFGGLFPNPSVVSAALAVTTKNIQIRAGSCVLPLHNPIRVAEEWSVVDNLSNGRTGIAVAAGWNPNDFVIKPENYADAKSKMAESIEVLRSLWRGETLSFPGPHNNVDVSTLPRPIQKELPIWITVASNPETFELAARSRAGVLTHMLGQSIEQVGKNLELYRKTWKECGHEGEGHVTLMLHTMVGEDDDTVREIVREPMKSYLENAANLVKAAAWHFPTFKDKSDETGKTLDEYFDNISDEDMDDLLEFSFQRYFTTSGLLGSHQRCIEMIDQLKEIGVDEVGCLIDFGIAAEKVLNHLENLANLRKAANGETIDSLPFEDYSISALIERHGVTHFQCTPSMIRMLLSEEKSKAALSKIKNIFVGGEEFSSQLAVDLKSVFKGELTNMYGPTETTIWSSTYDIKDAQGKISIGRPIANTKFFILDQQHQPVPIGVIGELYIGGLGVARGYLNRQTLTEERFITSPFQSGNDDRLYRTGDLVRYRPDGFVEFIGRVDYQVKIRGYRIELGEIETVLQQYPDIQNAVVNLHEDESGDKRIVAYIVAEENKKPVSKDVRAFLKDKLAEYMIPSMYVLLNAIPLTPNGKVNKKALPVPESTVIEIESNFIAPKTSIEKVLSEHWASLLNVKQVGLNDNFFELGGDSLLAIQVLCHIMESFKIQLPLHTIFRAPSIGQLTKIIEESNYSTTSNTPSNDTSIIIDS